MQAAKLPNESSSSFENDNSNTDKYILLEKCENKKYSIQISKTEKSILIEANQVQDPDIFYKISLNLNDFYQLSKGFKMFDNLEEICDALNNIFISQKVSITKKGYSFVIIFMINLIGGKDQEINIELNNYNSTKDRDDINNKRINKLEDEIKKLKTDNNSLFKKIKDLEDITKVQNNEINYLKNIINSQKTTIENLGNVVNDLKFKIGKINNLEKSVKQQKNEIDIINYWKDAYDLELEEVQRTKINNMTLEKIDSKIINKVEELEFLENRLKNNEILKKKNIFYKLLYRATRDGNDMRTFHNKCDNIMGTLSIIKTTKGMRFGGYTEKMWNCSSNNASYPKDAKGICFCFSFDLFKIYNFNDNYKSSICGNYNKGPYFFAKDCSDSSIFYVTKSNGTLIGYNNYTTKYNSFGRFDSDYEINNGKNDFSVIELEVFQILFDN